MNKKIFSLLAALTLTSVTLSACTTGTDDSNSASSSTSGTSETGSGNSAQDSSTGSNTSGESSNEQSSSSSQGGNQSGSSSSENQQTYTAIVQKNANVEVTLSTNGQTSASLQAHAGDTVTVNVTVATGYVLDHIEVNEKAINGTTFTMPADSAIVKAYVNLINEDGLIITGDISAELVEENGIYVARNVEVANNSHVCYRINGEDYSVTKIDNSKSFANLKLDSQKLGFTVGGNAVYDFYYDPSNVETPCYVVRTKVLSIPNSAASFAQLFEGSVKSETTVNPIGVNHVEYTSNVADADYTWDLYSNNSSLATVKSLRGVDKALVYKAQTGSTYTVVDNYVEGAFDSTKRDDTKSYSGKYDVVNSILSGYRSYQKTQNEVDIDANSYSHNTYSIDFEIWKGYRNYEDFMDDGEQALETTVSSVATGSDGHFTTTVDSWFRLKNSTVKTENPNQYSVYKTIIEFDAAGAIVSGSYTQTTYGTQYYNFSTNKFIVGSGYESLSPDKEITFDYTYGAAKSGQPTTDVSKYFISQLTNVSIKGNKCDEGKINVGEELTVDDPSDSYNYDGKYSVKFDYLPVTALDSWQYGPVNSSNKGVVNQKNATTPFNFIGVAAGTSTITLGNHTTSANTVTYDKDVTISSEGYLKSIWIYAVYPYDYYDGAFGAAKGSIEAGKKYTIQLAATTIANKTVMNGFDASFTQSQDGLLSFSFNKEKGELTIDATAATAITSAVTDVVTVTSTDASTTNWFKSEFVFTVNPGAKAPDSIVGTWDVATSGYTDYIEFTNTASTSAGYLTGSIHDTVENVDYGIIYKYNADAGAITAKVVSCSDTSVSTSDCYVYMCLFPEGTLGVCLYTSVGSLSDYTTTETLIFGGISYDEDDQIVIDSYTEFELRA